MKKYLLSIGSNIAPEFNVAKCLEIISHKFSVTYIHHPIYTTPIGLDSKSIFINTVITIETDLSSKQLKIETNKIETVIGRDRSDPDRKTKARPIDIDTINNIENESYMCTNYESIATNTNQPAKIIYFGKLYKARQLFILEQKPTRKNF